MEQRQLLPSSSLVVDRAASAPEVVPSTDKEAANETGKELVPDTSAEFIGRENLPEALDEEGGKEVVYRPIVPATPERPIRWLKEHKKTRWTMLVITALVMLAIGLGAGLGAALHRPRGEEIQGSNTSAAPSPIHTPPSGTYALALNVPKETPSTCLADSRQQLAWNCSLSPTAELGIVVRNSAGSGSGASMFYAAEDTRTLYGAWAPSIDTPFSAFTTVQDNDDAENGPAFYFQQYYDKVVVIQGAALQSPISNARRTGADEADMFDKRATEEPAAGDRIWLCVFNSTFMEGFIYVERPATTSNSTTNGTATVTSSTSTLTATGTSSTVTQTSGATAKPNNRPGKLDQYPLLVKIEERRLPNNAVQPYCQQYQITDDLSANWIGDSQGNPVIVTLSETASENSSETCSCQWTSGE